MCVRGLASVLQAHSCREASPAGGVCGMAADSVRARPVIQRPRTAVTAEALAETLAPFVQAKGAAFLKYEESLKGPIRVPLIVPHAPMVRALLEVDAGVIAQTKAVDAFRIVATSMGGIGLTEEQLRDWAETVSKRLRCMLRHVMQTQRKTPAARWLVAAGLAPREPGQARLVMQREAQATQCADSQGESELDVRIDDTQGEQAERELWADSSTAEDAADDAAYEAARQVHFAYGYDSELGMAWRMPAAGGQKQLTGLFQAKGADTDPIVAMWGDGDVHQVPEVTVAEHKFRQGCVSRGRAAPVWTGTTSAGEALAIVYRQDRSKLLVLLEGGRQVLQLTERQHGGHVESTATAVPCFAIFDNTFCESI